MSTHRIALLDDHRAVGDALAMALGAFEGIRVVGVAARCEDLVRIAHTQRPDVIMIDYQLIGTNGIECLDRMRTEGIEARFMLLLSAGSADVEFRARTAGFERVLSKQEPLANIARAVTSPFLVGEFTPAASPVRLSRRQREVLELMGQGFDPATIADQLFISVHTARSHVKDILRILESSTQLSAVVKAIRYGLLLPPTEHDAMAC